jgi:hypothetical protein
MTESYGSIASWSARGAPAEAGIAGRGSAPWRLGAKATGVFLSFIK